MPGNGKGVSSLCAALKAQEKGISPIISPGANSIAWYNEFLADPSKEAALTRILRYNEDDCRAMLAIKEYFERAAQATIKE